MSTMQNNLQTDSRTHLFNQAVALYGTTCLWNIPPQNTDAGLRVIAARLKAHGDMQAWRLAEEIEQGLSRGTEAMGSTRLQ